MLVAMSVEIEVAVPRKPTKRELRQKAVREEKISKYVEERVHDAISKKMDVLHLDFQNTEATDHAFGLLKEQGYERGLSWEYGEGLHVEFELGLNVSTNSPGKVKVWRALSRPSTHRKADESSPESSPEKLIL